MNDQIAKRCSCLPSLICPPEWRLDVNTYQSFHPLKSPLKIGKSHISSSSTSGLASPGRRKNPPGSSSPLQTSSSLINKGGNHSGKGNQKKKTSVTTPESLKKTRKGFPASPSSPSSASASFSPRKANEQRNQALEYARQANSFINMISSHSNSSSEQQQQQQQRIRKALLLYWKAASQFLEIHCYQDACESYLRFLEGINSSKSASCAEGRERVGDLKADFGRHMHEAYLLLARLFSQFDYDESTRLYLLHLQRYVPKRSIGALKQRSANFDACFGECRDVIANLCAKIKEGGNSSENQLLQTVGSLADECGSYICCQSGVRTGAGMLIMGVCAFERAGDYTKCCDLLLKLYTVYESMGNYHTALKELIHFHTNLLHSWTKDGELDHSRGISEKQFVHMLVQVVSDSILEKKDFVTAIALVDACSYSTIAKRFICQEWHSLEDLTKLLDAVNKLDYDWFENNLTHFLCLDGHLQHIYFTCKEFLTTLV
eukprot:Nk52_evm4s310 gene=Nk52_evmTU4s310